MSERPRYGFYSPTQAQHVPTVAYEGIDAGDEVHVTLTSTEPTLSAELLAAVPDLRPRGRVGEQLRVVSSPPPCDCRPREPLGTGPCVGKLNPLPPLHVVQVVSGGGARRGR